MTHSVQLPLGTSIHNNRQLFSDHFLNVVLPKRPEWHALIGQAKGVMRDLQDAFATYIPSTNEAQTEDGLIKPILHLLGHTFEVQAALRTPVGTKKPDYIFYRDQQFLNSNKDHPVDDRLPQQGAFAVGDAKYWDRPLDKALDQKDRSTQSKESKDALTNSNPGYQIDFYIRHSSLSWGILTNGRLWRLYHKDTSQKLDRYYEVDLPALLQLNDPELFLYFYAFFHRSAFEHHAISVDSMLKESADYARGVSTSLRTQVYDALRHIAQGFLDYGPNKLQPGPETLKQIYEASLILLYRMLFVLYAEARELLPVKESDLYRDGYSLESIKKQVERDLRMGKRLLPTSAKLWPSLKELFGIINLGSPPLKVTTYNGGLFDPARHPFLEQHTVGDAHLQQAIDMISRVGGQFVDYRDLSERHLGTIYEGLLEYHLAAIEPEGGWTIALLNDKGERKASGSYYTPDFIVKYIVDRTLGPVLDSKVEGLRDGAEIAQAVLSINVLDPAMGSGHFLLEATEYIARYLVASGVQLPGDTPGEPDIAAWKRRVVQSCIYGVDLNPLAVELAKLSLWLSTVAKDRPLSFLDHHLRVGNSIVGSWISDLGVADGTTQPSKRKNATRKKPEQESKEDKGHAGDAGEAVQLSMLTDDAFVQALGTAVDAMWSIEENPGDTVAQVKQQEQLYQQLRDTLNRRYGKLADVMTARKFGDLRIDLTPGQWTLFTNYVSGRSLPAMPQFADWLTYAQELDRKYHYFHWELEFPEVFFTREGKGKGTEAGFDSVIGNPPYVRQEVLGPFKQYFSRAYPETYHAAADLYVYFYDQGLRLCREGGYLSYIVTNKWMRAGYGEPLRAFFAAHRALEQIIDFGHAPIFEDADVFPCILLLRKANKAHVEARVPKEVSVTIFPREELHRVELDRFVQAHSHSLPQEYFGRTPWGLETLNLGQLMQRIRGAGEPLGNYAGARPLAGIKTGFNQAFLISSEVREQLIKAHPELSTHLQPYLRGRDIKRWSPSWEGLWIILLKSSSDYPWPWATLQPDKAEETFNQEYPRLYMYMSQWKDELQQRSDKGRFWWELRSCAYYDAFDKTNIFYQDLAYHSRFTFGTPGTIPEMTCFCLPSNDRWLLAVLNSTLMWSYMWRNVVHGKDEVLRLKTIYMQALPIASPVDESRSEVENAVDRLIYITKERQLTQRSMINWLRTEFGLDTPGQRLEDFANLTEDDFVNEVRKHLPRATGRLSPSALRHLRASYAEEASNSRSLKSEADKLEWRVSELVNSAYGLTPEDIQLLWETAPPRMPKFSMQADKE